MKKIINLFVLTLITIVVFNCEESDNRFNSNPKSGWIEFAQDETTVAVTSRTTIINIPVNYTAPINLEDVTVSYDVVNISGLPSNVITGLGSSIKINKNTNTNSILLDILPTAIQSLIDDGDVEFDIILTSASRGVPVGLSDGSSTLVHRVNLLCGGEPDTGTFTIDMHDSFGDGWQTDDGNGGSGLIVTLTDIDGEENAIEIGMCSPYGGSNATTFLGSSDCTGPASTSFFDATETFEVGTDIVGLSFSFPGDQYGEITFEIYNPDGSLLYAAGLNEPAGELPVSFCQ